MSIFPEFLIKPFRPYLLAILESRGSVTLTGTVLYSIYRDSLLSNERNRDPRRLLAHGFRGYSQHDEDGMIQAIFQRIGLTNRVFLEFGVGDGSENNTLYLLLSGWSGLWIDGSQANAETGAGDPRQAGSQVKRNTNISRKREVSASENPHYTHLPNELM